MKFLKKTCIVAICLNLIGIWILFFQSKECSPFMGISFIIAGLVMVICAWIFWHFIKYD